MATWVIQNILARSPRPGYDSHNVAVRDVEKWIGELKPMRIKSIICLLTHDQLDYYSAVPGGLLEYYRQQGFKAESIPTIDPYHDPINGPTDVEAKKEPSYRAFLRMPKPVLVHCSAGQDRTGPIVEYIAMRWSADGCAPAEHIS